VKVNISPVGHPHAIILTQSYKKVLCHLKQGKWHRKILSGNNRSVEKIAEDKMESKLLDRFLRLTLHPSPTSNRPNCRTPSNSLACHPGVFR
jgi:hypothetical protein